MVALENAGVGLQDAHRPFSLVVIGRGVAHVHERGDGIAGLGPVDPGRVAQDMAAFLKPLDPLHYGGTGEADLIGEGLVAGSAIGGEELEEAAADRVDIHHGGLPNRGRENLAKPYESSTTLGSTY